LATQPDALEAVAQIIAAVSKPESTTALALVALLIVLYRQGREGGK
jgi:hypothetical protein